MIAALAGGVGAARLLRGMSRSSRPSDITAIVNTGDDTVLHGLHISPDLDTVIYTLADAINPDTGWGLADETWRVMESLGRLGGITWFNLGDRDLATHCYRTQRLGEGAALGEVTGELARAWGVGVNVAAGHRRSRSAPGCSWSTDPRSGSRSTSSASATTSPWPASGSREPSRRGPGPVCSKPWTSADTIVVCPSNPVVSIDPLLAVPGVLDRLHRRRDRIVGVSPIVAGAGAQGPGRPPAPGDGVRRPRWSGWPGGTHRGWAPW